jgi:hypothetical protein
VPVDHLLPDAVSELGDRVRRDFGKLDILVNDIWGAELLKGTPSEWNTPIWKHVILPRIGGRFRYAA